MVLIYTKCLPLFDKRAQSDSIGKSHMIQSQGFLLSFHAELDIAPDFKSYKKMCEKVNNRIVRIFKELLLKSSSIYHAPGII